MCKKSLSFSVNRRRNRGDKNDASSAKETIQVQFRLQNTRAPEDVALFACETPMLRQGDVPCFIRETSYASPRRRTSLRLRDATVSIKETPHSSSAKRPCFGEETPHSSSEKRAMLHPRDVLCFGKETSQSQSRRRPTLHPRDAAVSIAIQVLSYDTLQCMFQ